VTERVGRRVVRVDPADGAKTVAVEVPEALTSVMHNGVLGLALHPELLAGTGNDYVYVSYTYDAGSGTDPLPRTAIRRYRRDPESGTLGEAIEVITGLPGRDDHQGGRLVFGPDRKLYLTVGDQGSNFGGNRCNPNRAQFLPTAGQVAALDWSGYEGKVLRIDPDGSIPEDNPVIGGVRSHVYSYGHRNPQGLVFDPEGGLFEAEHGPGTDDEVNRIEAGGNYGWPQVAGYRDDQGYAFEDWAASSPTPCTELSGRGGVPDSVPTTAETDWAAPDFQPPLATFFTVGADYDFRANGTATAAIAGLDIYTHTDPVPGWADSLLAASLTRGVLYRMVLDQEHRSVIGEPIPEFKSTNRYRDIAIRPDGRAFYIITDNTGGTRDENGARTATLANPGAIVEFSIADRLD
jgi:PQQ-dependent dehydrogenase (s-GDH family)